MKLKWTVVDPHSGIKEDAPANATGTAVAGTGDDDSVVPVRRKKKKKAVNNVKMIKRVLFDMERKKNGSKKTQKTT